MKFLKKALLPIFLVLLATSSVNAQVTKFKLMMQMSNYQGEKAYVVVSLMDSKGQYERTLGVFGSDKKWYNTLKQWHKAQSKKKETLHAITGASVAGGERKVSGLSIDNAKLDKGYYIRFESAVENQKYYIEDAVIPLTSAGLSEKTEGKGYIRYAKLTQIQ